MKSLKTSRVIDNEVQVNHRIKNISYDYLSDSNYLNVELEIEDLIGNNVIASACNDKLIISYLKKHPIINNLKNVLSKPLQVQLSLVLPFPVDDENISLKCENGLVSVMLIRKVSILGHSA